LRSEIEELRELVLVLGRCWIAEFEDGRRVTVGVASALVERRRFIALAW
jgi:hypothetical protein